MNNNRNRYGRFSKVSENCSGVKSNPYYPIWAAMIQRCENKNNAAYHNYGGRGIAVCEEWHDSKTFLNWLDNNGYRKGLDIDRADNDKGYYPENCRCVSRKANARNGRRNRRFMVYGEYLMLCEIEEKYNVLPDTFLHRVFSQKRTVEDALIRRGKLDIRTEKRQRAAMTPVGG